MSTVEYETENSYITSLHNCATYADTWSTVSVVEHGADKFCFPKYFFCVHKVMPMGIYFKKLILIGVCAHCACTFL